MDKENNKNFSKGNDNIEETRKFNLKDIENLENKIKDEKLDENNPKINTEDYQDQIEKEETKEKKEKKEEKVVEEEVLISQNEEKEDDIILEEDEIIPEKTIEESKEDENINNDENIINEEIDENYTISGNEIIKEEQTNRKLSKFKIILIAIAAIYLIGVLVFSRYTYASTSINGVDAGFKPVDNTFSQVELAPMSIKNRKDIKLYIIPEEAGMTLQDDIDLDIEQNYLLWPIELFSDNDYNVELDKNIDREKLKEWLENSDLNKDIDEPENAKIEKSGNDYIVIEEIKGNKLDLDKVVEIVSEAFVAGEKTIDIEDAYVEPEVTTEKLNDRLDALNNIKNSEITIKFDNSEEKLTDLQDYLNDDTYEIDKEKIGNFVNELKEKYDNQGKKRKFTTTSGNEIEIGGGIFGNKIHKDKTATKIIEAINTGKSETIEPVYTHKSMNGGEIGNSYIEISIAQQHMWFYKDGQLVVDTPVVTGTANGRYDTPKGVHEAWIKERNRFLRGKNSDGSDYKVPVKYWIQVDYTGVGIHDAYYRSSYGGSIYKSNGSHGCINTPFKNVKTIYDNLEKGSPVIIH